MTENVWILILGVGIGGLLAAFSVLIFIPGDTGGSKGKKVPPKGSRPNPMVRSKPNKMARGGVVRPRPVTDGMFPKPPKSGYTYDLLSDSMISAQEAADKKPVWKYEDYEEFIKDEERLKKGGFKIDELGFMRFSPGKRDVKEEREMKNKRRRLPPPKIPPFARGRYPSLGVHGFMKMSDKVPLILKDEEVIKKEKDLISRLTAHLENPTKYNFMKLKQFIEEEPKMKIYHTETQEDFDALMVELEKVGFLWASGKKPTCSLFKWNEFGKDTCIHLDNKFITRSDLAFVNQSYPNFAIEKYKANDNVNNPSHYNTGGIETLDYIKAKVNDYPSYAVGNIIKYITRYEHKNGVEDLKKAQFYLNDLIKWMEGEK